ncbi:MAG: hypothetical protein WD399_08350 [Thermoleophilaceae bacterium]
MIGIYLNDHLAGATGIVELVRRARGENEGTELGGFLSTLAAEIEQDRETLRELMASLEVGEDRVKQIAAWTAEKAGRLKLNGRLLGQSPLTPVVELEALQVGVTAKAALWRMLAELDDPRLAGPDFEGLTARAERQREQIDRHRIAAGRIALRGDGDLAPRRS